MIFIRFYFRYGIFLASLSTTLAMADNSVDIQQRLNQQLSLQEQTQTKNVIHQAQVRQQAATNMSTASFLSLPQVLYVAVQQGEWEKVRALLSAYEKEPNADQNLLRYAKAKLIWEEGEYTQSIMGLQKLVEDNPRFILGRLELGKALFLDQQNQEAIRQFQIARSFIDPQNPQQQGVLQTIQLFDQTLQRRDAWTGLFSMGYTYGTNLNQTPYKKDCQVFTFGEVSFESCRQTPPPIAASGWHYEANIQRRFSIKGHHGLSINVLAFGDNYPHAQAYSQHYVGADIAYSYKNVKHEWRIGPKVERVWQGGKIDHSAYGAEASWQYDITPRTSTFVSVSQLYQPYQELSIAERYNGLRTRLSSMLWQSLGDTWTVVIGVGTTRQAAKDSVVAYRENTLQLGILKRFGTSAQLMVQGFLSKRKYDKFDSLLEKRRQDRRFRLIASLKLPKWQVMGFYPSIIWEYEHNKSNISWLYSYNNKQIGIRLERRW